MSTVVYFDVYCSPLPHKARRGKQSTTNTLFARAKLMFAKNSIFPYFSGTYSFKTRFVFVTSFLNITVCLGNKWATNESRELGETIERLTSWLLYSLFEFEFVDNQNKTYFYNCSKEVVPLYKICDSFRIILIQFYTKKILSFWIFGSKICIYP